MKKSLISLLVGLSIGSSFAVSAAEEERWFEVEVIIFERNIDPAKVIEHWDQSLYPTYSTPNKDPMALFINDDNLITPNSSNERGLVNASNVTTSGLQPTFIDDSQTLPVFGTDRGELLIHGADTSTDIIKATNVVIDGANLKDHAKDPALQIVPASELQLTKQFTALNNHANYNVVLHTAWRMQPKDRNEAVPIRLFAGHNYQQQYQQNGDAVIAPVVSPLITTDITNSVNHTVDESNIIDLDNAATINDGIAITTIDTATTAVPATTTPAKPTVPVWEIDGELTIYLEHYLYAKTNLFVRKEGSKVIPSNKIVDTESHEDTLGTNAEDVDLLALLGIHLEPKQTAHNEIAFSSADVTIEDTDIVVPQDKTVPFLNSYPMQQLRVIRSGEIHYIDHPMFGMLIQIRKYEPPMTVQLEDAQ